MSKLLSNSHLNPLNLRTVSSILSNSSTPLPIQLTSHSISRSLFQPQIYLHNSLSKPHKFLHIFPNSSHQRSLSVQAFESSSETELQKNEEVLSSEAEAGNGSLTGTSSKEEYPSGEFEYKKITGWKSLVVKLRMLFAFPWQRVKKGSVLSMKLRGEISEQLKSRFSSELSLPQICENFIKAAYDPRISGVYLQIEPLNCGWAKVEEIRRHILNFKKSGKPIVAHVPACGQKEYYLGSACDELYAPPSAYFSLYGLTVQASFLGGVFEKVGIEPQVQRIGKYKSAGDQLTRKSMSEENCEMLTALLDNIYENWLDRVSSTQGKKKVEVENFINEGVYQIERLKEEGWITGILYDDERLQSSHVKRPSSSVSRTPC